MIEPRTLLCIFIVLLANVLNNAMEDDSDYFGYKVYAITPRSEDDLLRLNVIAEKLAQGLDIWQRSKTPGHVAKIMVAPAYQLDFETTLKMYNLKYNIAVSNVAVQLQKHKQKPVLRRQLSTKIDFTRFYRHGEINEALLNFVNHNPSRTKIVKTGESYEGRSMNAIWITNGDGRSKPMMFIDAGIHAREWLAPATSLYIIEQLVDNYQQYSDLLDMIDVLVLPSVNPDGYEYSHTNKRLWRKTRQPFPGGCFGADPNRNFGFHWGLIGSSSDPCDDTFHGPHAFSEQEAVVVKHILEAIQDKCIFYLTLHSFGSQLLYPWGWTSELPKTWRDIHEVATAGQIAIFNATGTEYEVGSSTNVIYPAAGGSDDYALGVLHIPIAITMELPGDNFIIDESLILEKAAESWIGIHQMALVAIEKYVT